MTDSRIETRKHISLVRDILGRAIADLSRRSAVHDKSKLVSPEVEVFDEYTEQLAGLEYGSIRYTVTLAKMKPALDHHYANNDHHPEWGIANEEWKPVVGFEGVYEVSNLGGVRSVTRFVEREGPTGNCIFNGRMLTAGETPKGYLRVQLSHNGKPTNRLVHRLVAEAFIPNPNPGEKVFVNHIDGDKVNNAVGNLEWVTPSENTIHAYEIGLKFPHTKYYVECVDLGITTVGCNAMERELIARGYEFASAMGIWRAINLDRGMHVGLQFVGNLISEGHPRSMIRHMNLMSLIEMVCDWTASAQRTKGGDVRRSIELNQRRFGYSDDLKKMFHNTVDALESMVTGPASPPPSK